MICARCKKTMMEHESTGESGIYRSCHILCEPCFFAEDAEIDAAGTNDLPETLAKYGDENDIKRVGHE